jgi:TNF receptor-associated protein 1
VVSERVSKVDETNVFGDAVPEGSVGASAIGGASAKEAEQAVAQAEKEMSEKDAAEAAAAANVIETKEEVTGAAESHSFQAETRQILDIVANSLYTDKEVFLRELISNASDALEKARYYQSINETMADTEKPFEVHITLNEEKNTLTIQDFGVGMTGEELVTNLGTIAKSGSKAFMNDLAAAKQDGTDTSNIIGQFGVGFYSCFMVGSKVDVYSKHAIVVDGGEPQAHFWTSDGSGSYDLSKASGAVRGTKIVVHLKDDCSQFAKKHTVEGIIKKYSNFVGFPIFVNGEAVNTVSAVWMRTPAEVTEAEHADFYKYLANAYDTPTYRMHFNTDVPLQIHSLFYFPERHMEKYGSRWCDCSCDVHLCSLHSAHANLTVNVQLFTHYSGPHGAGSRPLLAQGAHPGRFNHACRFCHSLLALYLLPNTHSLGSITHVSSINHYYLRCICYQTLTFYSFLASFLPFFLPFRTRRRRRTSFPTGCDSCRVSSTARIFR